MNDKIKARIKALEAYGATPEILVEDEYGDTRVVSLAEFERGGLSFVRIKSCPPGRQAIRALDAILADIDRIASAE